MVEGMEHHSPGPAWLLKELVLAIFLHFPVKQNHFSLRNAFNM